MMATASVTSLPLSFSGSRLANKTAIVTGGASGIGRAICLAYASEGAKVIVADLFPDSRTESEAQEGPTHEVIARHHGHAIYVKVDVTDAMTIDEAIVRCVSEWGRLDIMVNNAGIAAGGSKPVWEIEDETWHRTMQINGTGTFYGVRSAAKQMITQEPGQTGDRGWIINLASVYGLIASSNSCSYISSKHLVMGLTKSAALDLAPYRIHVNAICPGYTKSNLTAVLWEEGPELIAGLNAKHPFGGMGVPEDLSRIALFLASDDSRWVTGQGIVADGGYTCQ